MLPESIAALGQVMQLAFVPADFDAALRFWTTKIGAGPFFSLEHVRLKEARYRGSPVEIDFSIMLGYWGEMQIELIRQHNDAPSIFKSFRDQGCEGLHHVCILVDEIAGARRVAERVGLTIAQEAIVPGGGEVIYLDTGGGPGSIVEILKPAPGTDQFFKMMRDAHRNWDGREPVRKLG